MSSHVTSTDLLGQVFRNFARRSHAKGLNPAQWTALRFFADADLRHRSPSEFAKFHKTTKGTASQTIAVLVRKSYLRRSRSTVDRRVTVIHVTPEGRRLLKCDPMAPILRAITRLPAHDVEVIEDFLRVFLQTGL